MASLRTVICLGVCLYTWTLTAAENNVPKAENLKWVSLDFKTIIKWTAEESDYKYTVSFSSDDNNWSLSPDCIRITESECDLTEHLTPYDRAYKADIQTEPDLVDYDEDLDNYPHTYSDPFNPYRESKISAVDITVEAVDESRVMVNITDPLTGIHRRGKQLSLRDILQNDLKYKISYYKSGSTGKRDNISDSSMAEVSKLDAGESYCFMAAAFIPSRPKSSQLGAWSQQLCTPLEGSILHELNLGFWVGITFILLTVFFVIVTVTVLCCRCCRQRNSTQSSTPV
ncbi:Tissue factor [Dissostichus eleginoides]|uniref:Tissue factor n=1 Tax=Dissostichus eleginoides TaxID=100907 RepID=A0AAD9ESC4_DISEL|nr:Tissue factor [Dissostichus eleginoides]